MASPCGLIHLTMAGAKDCLMTDTALNALRRAQFDVSDIIRRAQGDIVGAFGLDPKESPHQIITSRAHWRLRDAQSAACIMVVAAFTDRNRSASPFQRGGASAQQREKAMTP